MPRLNNVSNTLKVSLKRNYNLSSVSLLGGVVFKWPLTPRFPKLTFRQSTQIFGYMRRFIFLYASLFPKKKRGFPFGKPLYFMGFIISGNELSFCYQIFDCILICTKSAGTTSSVSYQSRV